MRFIKIDLPRFPARIQNPRSKIPHRPLHAIQARKAAQNLNFEFEILNPEYRRAFRATKKS